MRVDIDYLIALMEKYTPSKQNSEIGEQETASSGGGSKNNVTTWSGIVGSKLTRGHANKLGLSGEKWESGVKRDGPANQLT
jgi:hypothetical protein